MIYLISVTSNDSFCLAIVQNPDYLHIKITDLVEFDNINLWFQSVVDLYKKYDISYHYYMGCDEHLSILKLAVPDSLRMIGRKERDDLSFDKLVKKLSDNVIELASNLEYLKSIIFTDDIKIDTLKLIASSVGNWVTHQPRETVKPLNPFGDTNIKKVLKLFE